MVRQFLKQGKENAVSLENLAKACHLSKRAVRDMISEINTAGEEIICSDGKGKGYYIAATKEEADSYIRYSNSYFKSQLEKVKGMERCRDRKFSGQMVMEV